MQRLFVSRKRLVEMLAVTLRRFRNERFQWPWQRTYQQVLAYGRRNQLISFNDVDIKTQIEAVARQHMGRRDVLSRPKALGPSRYQAG
jgi:hypothetical protein